MEQYPKSIVELAKAVAHLQRVQNSRDEEAPFPNLSFEPKNNSAISEKLAEARKWFARLKQAYGYGVRERRYGGCGVLPFFGPGSGFPLREQPQRFLGELPQQLLRPEEFVHCKNLLSRERGLESQGLTIEDWPWLRGELSRIRNRASRPVNALVSWTRTRIRAEFSEAPSRITHAPDFIWLRVGDQQYDFKKGNQARAIEALFRAWESSGCRDGCGMSEQRIGEEIGSESDRFRILVTFRENSALGTILKSPKKGVYALYLADPNPGSSPAG